MISPSAVKPTNSQRRALDPDIERGLRWAAIRQIVTALASTVGVLFYARYLTPDALGAASLALLVYEGLYLLIHAPINHAVVYYQDEAEHPSAAFWLLMAFGIPAALGMMFLAPVMGRFYRSEEAAPLTQAIMVAYIMLLLATVPGAVLIKQMRFHLYEGFQTIYHLVVFIGWVVFSVLGFGAWSLILPVLLGAIFWVGAVWAVTRFRPMLRPSRRAFNDIFRFARSLWGSELLTYLMRKMDNAAVGTLGEGSLGLYAFGEDNSSFAALSVASVVAQVTLPALAKVQARIDEFRRTYLDMLRLTAAAAMPMQIGALVIADLWMRLSFGSQWDGAVPVFRAYVLFQILDSLTVLGDAAMSASGRPYIRLRMNLVQLPLFIGATWYGLSVWGGILGVALSLAVVRSLAAMAYLGITWRILHLPARGVIRALAPSTLAAGFMGLAALGVRLIGPANDWLLLAAVVGVAMLVYGALLWLIDRAAFVQVWDAGMQIFVPLRLRERAARRFPRLKRVLTIQT